MKILTLNITDEQLARFHRLDKGGNAIGLESAAQRMFEQFLKAPPSVVSFLAGTNPGDVWAHHAALVRGQTRQEFADEVQLAELFHKVTAKRHK